MKSAGRVKILETASSQFGRAGERELFNFLDLVEENCDLLSADHEKATAYAFSGYGNALVLPYAEAGQFVGELRRKDPYGKIVPFGTQNWIHLGNLACELARPPLSHSEFQKIKMRKFFPQRPNLTEKLLETISNAAGKDAYASRLSSYLQAVRFNNV